MEEDYYSRPEMSNSQLTAFINGPMNGISQKSADHGHLFHTAIFEPHLYPSTLERTKERVTDKEVKTLTAMSEAAKRCHSLQVFLSNPKVEFEKEFYGDMFGVPFRMKTDIVVPNALGDGKSTAAKTLEQFLESCKKYGYWRQAFIYMKLANKPKMMFWGVSKSYPHNTFYIDVSKYPEEMKEAELQVEMYCKRWLEKDLEVDPFAAFYE